MNVIRSFALAAAVTLSTALPAPAAFLFSEPLLQSGAAPLSRIDAETARAAAEAYFSYDAVITLGALALAGGALAAFGGYATRRRAQEEVENGEPAWRESVFRAIQADLAQFTESFRRAA